MVNMNQEINKVQESYDRINIMHGSGIDREIMLIRVGGTIRYMEDIIWQICGLMMMKVVLRI